ncbi:MAG: exodeoxyribonuclease VII large subunit [Proteobacteria bacterium]|nr:exodeoxyribonuclease VII large subunit [Pseudomonadota bacterium]MBU1709327.1 exodeoxyribonuclease VII large subunit [Pseudomonadota bacterium]
MNEQIITRIQTVTEVTSSIKGILETGFAFISIIGEISNLRIPASGHIYFTLKDQNAQIKAVLFKMQRRYLDHLPSNGQEIIARGRISLYELRGEYQIIVDTIDFQGKGALQFAFEELKKEFFLKGFFDESHKKPLPTYPEQITVVTAPTGAAIFDFLKIAQKRFPLTAIDIFPVHVQGPQAAREIAQAIDQINKTNNTQIILLCRGGGSIEDLWAFNEKIVAEAVYASNIPVVSAVGHEIDYTIADFVADLRAPTPTAAAEIILPDIRTIKGNINKLNARLLRSFQTMINEKKYQVSIQKKMLRNPSAALAHFILRLEYAGAEMTNSINRLLASKKTRLFAASAELLKYSPQQRLLHCRRQVSGLSQRLQLSIIVELERKKAVLQKTAALLDSVSPLAVLGRGYSITRLMSGKTIKNSNQVEAGDMVNVLLHRGKLCCEVKKAEG